MISRKDAAWLAIISAGAILTKVALLLTSQSALDGDEAIVGLMALHVKNGVSHPLFFYGQAYDAGAGILAHMAALLFSIGGVSDISVKATAFLVWLGMVAVGAKVAGQLLGWRAAAIAERSCFGRRPPLSGR
jgi:hypothetical protein